jgi:hypothetical protein
VQVVIHKHKTANVPAARVLSVEETQGNVPSVESVSTPRSPELDPGRDLDDATSKATTLAKLRVARDSMVSAA